MVGKYRTVVIDPPWNISWTLKHNNHRHGTSYTDEPYRIMQNGEVINFPIDDYADDNCHLFLWCTHKTVRLAMDITRIWGFTDHAIITWAKRKGPVLVGVHRNTELCLMVYRGRWSLDIHHPIPLLIEESSTRHSEKPRKFYNHVRAAAPEPRADIFGRRRHVGFSGFGDQIEPSEQGVLM